VPKRQFAKSVNSFQTIFLVVELTPFFDRGFAVEKSARLNDTKILFSASSMNPVSM
jgi:hypothetical protein